MKIEQIDRTRILISLGEADLKNYSVTFESLSLSEEHSRQVLRELLHTASSRTGISFHNKRIVIEALKYEHGCLLLLTLSSRSGKKKRYRLRFHHSLYLFRFECAEHLLSCIAALYPLPRQNVSSSVFREGERYYLAISAGLEKIRKIAPIAGEFGDPQHCGAVDYAFLLEHTCPLVRKTAIETIGMPLAGQCRR